MARGGLLFSKFDLRALLEARDKQMQEEINGMEENEILDSSESSLCDFFETKYSLHLPKLKTLSIEQDPHEVDIDVSRDPQRMIYDRSRPFYLKGLEVSFHVPFEGEPELLDCRANQFSLSPPRGEIHEGRLVLTYQSLTCDANAMKKELYADLARIDQQLEWTENQVGQFNRSIRANVAGWVAQRRTKLLNDKGMVQALGFPLRRRDEAPQTYAVPAVRRKPPVARPAASPAPFKPEPTINMEEYEHILSVISNMVAVMERSPLAFRDMREEDLRQHFLVQLNGQYEGQATGETFNFEGKTDILIRAEGKNIFIAECKFWRGSESLREAIDQLLGYASWRDTKTALVIFNRDRQLSTVLPKIAEAFRSHPNLKRQLNYDSETGFRFVLHHRDDRDRELIVTLLVFEVPA
jgi:hypothetical protein